MKTLPEGESTIHHKKRGRFKELLPLILIFREMFPRRDDGKTCDARTLRLEKDISKWRLCEWYYLSSIMKQGGHLSLSLDAYLTGVNRTTICISVQHDPVVD